MVNSRNNDDPPDDSCQPRTQREPQCVQLFLDRFPHVREVSEQLLRDSDAFRELCEAYEACSEAIDQLAHRGTNDALLAEYSTLRVRLEGELLLCISDHYSVRSPR